MSPDHLDLGGAHLRRITDLDRFALPLSLLFPEARQQELEPFRADLAPWHYDFDAGAVLLGVHSLLLRLDGLTVLIDTCVGACKLRPARPEWHARKAQGYLAALAAAGLGPEDIDMVFCTHLHADHVGWNTRLQDGRWVPTFPRARYVMGRAEHDHWQKAEAQAPGQHNHGAYADSVLPVVAAGQADLVEDGADLHHGLSVLPLPGHSPGQTGLALDLQGRRVVFCGDAIHSPLQIFRPDWSSRFCHDPDQARRTRLHLLEQAAAEDLALVPAHLRGALGLRVRGHGGGFRPAPLF